MIDVTLPGGEWHDLYAEASVTVGTEMLCTVKCAGTVYFWEGASEPAAGAGVPKEFGDAVMVEAGSPGCWVRCNGAQLCVNVQT